MSLTALIVVWVIACAARLMFLAAQWRNLEGLWYDFERRGLLYRIATAIDLVTFGAYFACALYGLWHVQEHADTLFAKCVYVWVAWLGLLLLERLPIHRFPRTNHPQLFSEAKVALLAHGITALIGSLVLAALSAVWFWLRS